jgi:hypothetical protein
MALAIVLDNLLETTSELQMQSKACWRAAVWLASTCRELRERSTVARKRATHAVGRSARGAMSRGEVLGRPDAPPTQGRLRFVFASCTCTSCIKQFQERMKKEDRKCARMDEELATPRAKALLPFMREARDFLRWACSEIDDEYASYFRRHRLQPRTSTFNVQGRMRLALEDFEHAMDWRTDRPFRDAHFRPL